jgi:RNA-directed DNA polymerase
MADRAFCEFVSWDNLMASYRLAARGKRGTPVVARYELRLGDNLRRLQRALWDETWQPGGYVSFHVHEPKRRLISAAPFEDRIVHHALCRVLQPRFERSFLPTSYANRKGLGTHRAIRCAARWASRYRYVLRMDVRQHFASIDHGVLQQALWLRVPERGLRRVISVVLASGDGVHSSHAAAVPPGEDLLALCRPRGLPIGNLTSQDWSNVLMDALDQFVRRTLRGRAYLRYVDDIALFGDDPSALWQARQAIVQFLRERLRLQVHERSAQVHACAGGVPWLGFVLRPASRRLKARKLVQATRRLVAGYRAWQQGDADAGRFDAQVQGWIAHARHAQTLGLRASVLKRFPLGRFERSQRIEPAAPAAVPTHGPTKASALRCRP